MSFYSHTLSMSKVHLAMICAWSFRADVGPWEESERGEKQRIGIGAHGRVEDWFHRREPRYLEPDIADKAARTAKRLIEWLEPKRDRILHCEVGLRYDAENDRAAFGPKRGEEGYGDVSAMVLPGTLDLALRGEDGVLEVIDVKTGQKRYVHQEQVDTQGLALSRLLKEDRVRVGFIYPRLTKCDEPEMTTLDANDLDIRAGELHSLMRRLPVLDANPGEWCWQCDARTKCPTRRDSYTPPMPPAEFFGDEEAA